MGITNFYKEIKYFILKNFAISNTEYLNEIFKYQEARLHDPLKKYPYIERFETNIHEVIYNKSCNNKEEMLLIEKMVLTKLKSYKEVANRDRFILPINQNINGMVSGIQDLAINLNNYDRYRELVSFVKKKIGIKTSATASY